MTKLHKTTIAFLLAAALLMTGCAEHSNILAPDADTNTNTSSDISDSNSSESTDNSSESSGSSNNSTSTKSESSSSDTSDSVSESESSSETESNSDSISEESSDTSDYTIPIELTDEDKELQKNLKGLEDGAKAIHYWFTASIPRDNHGMPLITTLAFHFPEINNPGQDLYFRYYYPIPDGYSEAGFVIPNTCDGIRKIMLEYFSERCTNSFMNQVGTGRITENSDGTFTVMLDDKEKKWAPRFLEIDGIMYRDDCVGGKGIGFRTLEPDTAKIVSKTDDTIEFTYLSTNWMYYDFDEDTYKKITDESQYTKTALTGFLKYERGGWRRDWDKDDLRRD